MEEPQELAKTEGAEKGATTQKFLLRLFGPVTDTAAQHLSLEFRALAARRHANLLAVVALAEQMHQDVDIAEPHELPLNVSVPMLEAASLCENDGLQQRWAALLANASSGKMDVEQMPSFVDVLRHLSPVEAKLLESIASCQSKKVELSDVGLQFPTVIECQVALGNLRRGACLSPELGFTALVTEESPEPVIIYQQGEEFAQVNMTWFGLAFMQACQTPTSTE